jgi:hypothetical protein
VRGWEEEGNVGGWLMGDNRGLEHSADPDEIDDVEKFLNERIPAVGDRPTL